jgi:hypothetical protein
MAMDRAEFETDRQREGVYEKIRKLTAFDIWLDADRQQR